LIAFYSVYRLNTAYYEYFLSISGKMHFEELMEQFGMIWSKNERIPVETYKSAGNAEMWFFTVSAQ
jgi:hypothetical protein